jgi:translation initiation factor IF-2
METSNDNFVEYQKPKKQWKANRASKRRDEKDEDDDDNRASYRDEDGDFEEDGDRPRRRRRRQKDKRRGEGAPTPIILPEFISVGNLADALMVRKAEFLRRVQDMGFEEATFDHVIDAENAGLIAAEFNFEAIFEQPAVEDLEPAPPPVDVTNLPLRPPVVTIMGHVDHGKTTILDWLRKSSVAASEHGGITQHIGAFSVMMPSGKLITFLDTPGHAAFLDMRRRGANMTDIVILVVAADDSVKPQTIEAIKHAKEAGVPMIVAMNKVDKPDINIQKVKQDLARHNVNIEDFGGDVQTVPVSGKTGLGMLELEEATVALAEMLDLRGDPEGNVEGWVVEATTKKGGRVATVLVKRGTLRAGQVVVAGKTWARIRSLKNEVGVRIEEATPGTPVEIDGWREQPIAGSEVLEAPSEQRAKDVVEMRIEMEESEKLRGDMTAINENRRAERDKRQQQELSEEEESVLKQAEEESKASEGSSSKEIPFIIKADVSGSVEAILNSVSSIGNNEVYPKILRSGVGAVSEFDIKHAAVAKGMIVSFNQPVDQDMLKLARADGVRILNHTIIYELIDDVKEKLSEYLAPTITQRVLGEAEIAEVFEIKLKRRETALVAGCRVKNGVIGRNHKVKVLRGDEVIHDGKQSPLPPFASSCSLSVCGRRSNVTQEPSHL